VGIRNLREYMRVTKRLILRYVDTKMGIIIRYKVRKFSLF